MMLIAESSIYGYFTEIKTTKMNDITKNEKL